MTISAGEPTLSELARTLGRIEDDMSRRLGEIAQSMTLMVTRDLYEAHRSAMQDDIAEIREQLKTERETRAADQKADQERKAADRRMVVGAVIGAVLSLLVAIVSAGLLIAFGLNP